MNDAKLMTRVELARALRKNPQSVTKWLAEGMPVAKRGKGGRASLFDPEAVGAWLEARNTVVSDGPVDVARERARKERAQAILAEQLAASRARELLPVAEVERVWSAERDAIRTAVLTLPSQAPRVFRVGTLDGEPGVEKALKEIAHEILRELAAGTYVKADEGEPKQKGEAA